MAQAHSPSSPPLVAFDGQDFTPGMIDNLNHMLEYAQRLSGLGELSACMAYELAHPLSIIAAACGNLLAELRANAPDAERLTYYVTLIESSALRGARVVDLLRHYGYRDQPQWVVSSVEVIVRDLLILIERQFLHEARVKVEVEMPEHVRSIVWDHNRIMQLLLILLGNARDAMQPKGGTIGLSFWTTRGGQPMMPRQGSTVPAAQKPEQLAFAIRDHGPGIDPGIAGELFKPFFTTKRDGSGAGLGLFVAEGIVRQHGGRISAQNNPSPPGGATFTVLLPLGVRS